MLLFSYISYIWIFLFCCMLYVVWWLRFWWCNNANHSIHKMRFRIACIARTTITQTRGRMKTNKRKEKMYIKFDGWYFFICINNIIITIFSVYSYIYIIYIYIWLCEFVILISLYVWFLYSIPRILLLVLIYLCFVSFFSLHFSYNNEMNTYTCVILYIYDGGCVRGLFRCCYFFFVIYLKALLVAVYLNITVGDF